MSTRSAVPGTGHYELRVEGDLDEHWSAWFGGLTLNHEDDGTTTLRGGVTDQAELHGLLARVRDIGARLISLKTVEADDCDDVRMDNALDAVRWPVRTDRLTIRRATEDDVEVTWRFRQLESVSRWLTRMPTTLEDYRIQFEDPARLANTLVIELDGEVIGDLMLRVEDAWSQTEVQEQAAGVQAELGWVLRPDHVGHGYATEAVRELLRICFEDLGLRRVTALCFAANVASWRLMERVGMRRELHAIGDSLHRSGDWIDGVGYAILSDEWSASAG